MKASELRIGNYIAYPKYWGDKPIRVTGVSIVDRRDDHSGIYEEFLYLLENDFLTNENFDSYIDYKQGVISPINAQPIPLTEEWLLKFGFKELKRFTHEFEEVFYGKSIIKNQPNHYEQLVVSLPTNHVEVGEFNIDESYLLNIFVTHVHQLQNLYFALTGEELTLKEI